MNRLVPLRLGVFNLFICAGAWVSGTAMAESNLKPVWISPDQSYSNESFLNNYQSVPSKPGIGLKLVDSKSAKRIQQEYEDLNREYDMKSKYGLLNQNDILVQNDRMRGFGRTILFEAKNAEVRKKAKVLQEAWREDESMKPVMVAAAVGAACFGEPVNVRLGEETKFYSRTNLRDQRGQFSLTSPVLNSEMEVVANAPNASDPSLAAVDPLQKYERYRLSVSRGVPNTDITSAMTYGSSSSTLTASVAKPLHSNLTAIFGSQHPLVPTRSDLKTSEQSLRLNYRISF